MRNSNLIRAKQAKNDEFYTRIEDIEKEVSLYSQYLKDKVIYCNCDDLYVSNFFRYFANNFKNLGIKKVISTCYNNGKGAFKAILDHQVEDVDKWLNSGNVTLLNGDGDFASEECVKLLDEADIVVTNMPFSKFRKYVSLLMEHKKQFLIIGNKNAITYKEIFPLIKENKLWLGCTSPKEFMQPKCAEPKKMNGLTRWFTNLPVEKCEEYLDLFENYSPDKYPMYDNYLAINVDRVSDIPCNEWFIMTVNEDRYNKLKATYGDDCVLIDGDDVNKQYRIKVRNIVMGVPITFLDKYCSKQFCIIGHEHDLEGTGKSEGAVGGQLMVQKKGMYKRILIRKKHKQEFTIIGATVTWNNNLFKTVPNADSGIIDGKVKYFRVLIRRDNCGV